MEPQYNSFDVIEANIMYRLCLRNGLIAVFGALTGAMLNWNHRICKPKRTLDLMLLIPALIFMAFAFSLNFNYFATLHKYGSVGQTVEQTYGKLLPSIYYLAIRIDSYGFAAPLGLLYGQIIGILI